MMMMPFSIGTELERVGFVGLDQDYLWAELEDVGLSGLRLDCCCATRQALDVALLCKKNQKEEGPARASPVATPMPKLVSF